MNATELLHNPASRPLFEGPIVKRAILRYCLQAKNSKAADAFVAARKVADLKAVEEAEELLKLEQETIKPETPVTKK